MTKVLIIRFSSIGDIVLTTPVVRCLHQLNNVEVHYLTKKSFENILTPNPYIHKVWTIEKEVKPLIPQLKAENFDYIIDLHKNLRTLQVKNFLRAKSYSFNKLNWEKWLIVNWKINRLPNVHIVDRYMQTVNALGVKYDGKGLDYFIRSEDVINISKTLNIQQEKYIAFVIGAAHATKRMPTEKIIEICSAIKEPIVLLGGPNEAKEGAEIANKAGNHVINMCGVSNLGGSASLVEQARIVVTHDTGMMHIAAAFNKNIISIWGNTIPEFGMYPFFERGKGKNNFVQAENVGCRPCSKIGYEICPKQHFNCMDKIQKKDVVVILSDKS